MNGYISREEAISALEKWEAINTWDEWCNEHKNESDKHISAPSSVIRDLPSVNE